MQVVINGVAYIPEAEVHTKAVQMAQGLLAAAIDAARRERMDQGDARPIEPQQLALIEVPQPEEPQEGDATFDQIVGIVRRTSVPTAALVQQKTQLVVYDEPEHLVYWILPSHFMQLIHERQDRFQLLLEACRSWFGDGVRLRLHESLPAKHRLQIASRRKVMAMTSAQRAAYLSWLYFENKVCKCEIQSYTYADLQRSSGLKKSSCWGAMQWLQENEIVDLRHIKGTRKN
jgi:hypothetical protein